MPTINPNEVQWDPIDPAAVQWDDAKPKAGSKGIQAGIAQGAGNLAAGALRGAGSIGATLLWPVDKLMGTSNAERRQKMDQALAGMGAETDSWMYQGGKLAGEIAGTAGAGGAAANVVGRGLQFAPALATKAAPMLQAMRTAGMSAPGAGIGTRMAGGAISGGLSAGMVNPEDAGAGALIGGALPGATKLAGMAGQKVGSVLRGPAQTPEIAAAVKAAQEAGYVIPPTQANASLRNRLLEGMSGKITTAQNASARNQGVTNKLAAEALGLPGDTKLTADVLQTVRQQAGQAYQAVGSTGMVKPSASYMKALDDIAEPFKIAQQGFPGAKPSPVLDLVESLRSPEFDAAAAVSKIRELRSAADDAFRAGSSDVGRAAKKAAGALEDALEEHLQGIGSPEMLDAFRGARTRIAKTYTVEKALNQASGTVDARKLASQLQKGKPLSGELRQAAQFAATFPKASQAVEGMGSLPQTSPLDWGAAAMLAGLTTNPLGLLAAGARPAARAMTLSPMVQRGLLQTPRAASLLDDPRLLQAGYRAAPLLAIDQ